MMEQVTVRKITTLLMLVFMVFAAPRLVLADTAARQLETPVELNTESGELQPQAEAEHAADAHGEEAHAPEDPPLLPSILKIAAKYPDDAGVPFYKRSSIGKFLKTFDKQIYTVFVVLIAGLLFLKFLKNRASRPGRLQVAVEMFVEGLSNFYTGIVGKEHRKHVPFLCSLFLFIWLNNLTALVPMMAPMTAAYWNTITLAMIVFVYFIFYGIKDGGLGHFIWHMAGSPNDVVGWVVSPFIFFLELVGTLAKPLSLSLRLYGNILGEDILLGVALMLGMLMATAITPEPIIGVPLHLPFMFLVLLGGTIQAFVFTLLSAIYLSMVLPHHDHEHDEEHGAEKQHHGETAPAVAAA